MEVPVRLQGDFTPWLQKVMTDAVDVLGFPVTYVTASPTSTSYVTVDQDALVQTANPHLILAAHIRAMVEPVVNPFPNADPSKVMYLDIETHNEGKQWGMAPSEFFRLGQWAWGIDGEIHVTTDYHEFMAQVAQAEGLVAHNGHNFDFSVLFGADSVTPLRMAQKGMLLDTMVWANLAFPAPPRYMARSGAFFRVTKPGEYMRWLSLDNLAFQLDVPGKLGDLKTLAKKHNPPKTPVGELDFGLIPLDDPEFLAYAEADVKVLQDVVRKLALMSPLSEYDWREQLTSAVMAQITRNGWTVDLPAVHRRRDSLLERRAEIMDMLVRDFDFPTEGKAPWASAAGKEAIERIVLHYNPDAHDSWPKTPKGALKMGGDELRALLDGTEGEEVGTALAELKGQRSLSQLTIDSVKADGKVHPDISPLQRSGRFSVTNPGLTVWTARGENAVEKAYFVPSNGSKLVSFDLSNADARAVAAYSGDKAYRKNFLPGVDNHMNVASMVYGEQDDFEENKPHYRNLAKACLAEGTLVLTDQGEVPIEEITLDHLLWDGESFVKHEGMVYNGLKEVIHYDGIIATPDHKVYTTEGLEVPFGVAASRGYTLEVTGDGGRPVSTSHDYFRPGAEEEETEPPFNRVCASGVCDVWSKRVAGLGQPIQRENERVSSMHIAGESSELSSMVGETTLGHEATVSEPGQPRLPVVRGAGDNVRVGLNSGSGSVDNGERDTTRPDTTVRSDRQRSGVWSGEHSHGDSSAKHVEQKEHDHSSLGPGRVALLSECCSEETEKRNDEGRDHPKCSGRCGESGVSLETRQGKVRVYDILNVGPHHRFTANGKLVANCSHAWNYGGGAKTISRAAGVDAETAQHFVANMAKAFPGVVKWRNRMAELGERQGFIKNKWGRKMPVERDHAYTQSSALMGQSGTREIMVDAVLKMLEHDIRLVQWIKAIVHDEFVFDIPESELAWAVPTIKGLMYYEWDGVEFHADNGEPADNWELAGH